MPPPVATIRTTPTARKLDDGFKTLITLASAPGIEFWEVDVSPPGLDGGDGIDATTMHSIRWRTKSPRKLISMGDVKSKVQYNPSLYTAILALINKKDTITVSFPDGATLAFFGFLRSFEPGALSEGNIPDATITIVPTNADPVTGAEAEPVFTPAPAPAPAPAGPGGYGGEAGGPASEEGQVPQGAPAEGQGQ